MIELTHFSVVVLAQAHNPTILNPDFLKNTGILVGEYKVKNFICTPPVAHVVYEEGISIIAEFEKIQFIDELPTRLPFESPIPKIAIDYINKLPYVNYTAAGINFAGHHSYSDNESVRAFIKDKFVKDGPWIDKKEDKINIGLNFIYTTGNIKRSINVTPNEYKKTETDTEPIVLLRYNHHLTATDGDTNAIVEFIADWKSAFNKYKEFADNIFSEI